MATPDAPPMPVPPTADAVRVVIFGLPGAGKSSLLGALGEAAKTQEDLLHGRLKDLSQGLADLQAHLYNQPPPTAAEVIPYPVVFEPFADGTAAEPVRAVVLDCGGRAANELVAHPETLDRATRAGTLAGEVAAADTLVLAVDASAPPEQLETEFGAFERFLREMEEGRSARVEVGGLPVFLVLTKCDRLARSGDTTVDWMERVEQRKREVGDHFREFLTRRENEMGPLPFGELELQLWATAIKRPALAGTAEQRREPYGVAELFRQCLDHAAVYRRRVQTSSRRLFWLGWTAATGLAAMVLLVLFLMVRPGARLPSDLELAIEMLQFSEKATPAARLRAPLKELQRRRDKLRDLQNDPGFNALPADLCEFVVSRHNELDKYIKWLEQVQQVHRPASLDTEEGLVTFKKKLEKLEKKLDKEWEGTEAARLYRERLDEVNALLNGVKEVKAAYLGDAGKAEHLLSFQGYHNQPGTPGVNWRLWNEDLEKARRTSKPATFKQTDPLPGSPTLTYAIVMRIDTVRAASKKREQLDRLRNVCAALGLIDPTPARPPALVIEKPPAFKLTAASEHLRQLQKYPNYKEEFSRAGLFDQLPRDVAEELDRAVRANYKNLLEPARALVLTQLQKAGEGDKETPARWTAVREWLAKDPDELDAWRQLALPLARLQNADATDPVTALVAFLHKMEFPLEIKEITLVLPDRDSKRAKAPPNAELTIFHPRVRGKEAALRFEQPAPGEYDAERRVTTYTFRLVKGTASRVDYLPGDDLSAILPLTNDLQLTWDDNHMRSKQYQFERLWLPPWIHKAGAPVTSGDLADGVRVVVVPPEGWPRVPDLLPEVRLSC